MNTLNNNKVKRDNRNNKLINKKRWKWKERDSNSKFSLPKKQGNLLDDALYFRFDGEQSKKFDRKLDCIIELMTKLIVIGEKLEREKSFQKKKTNQEKSHVNEKWKSKYQPMTLKVYNLLISSTQMNPISVSRYKYVRLRVALCILFLTGIKLNELLKLKVYHLETLVDEYWISIDSYKRGRSNHKAFLTEEGKKIIQAREQDFAVIFHSKTPNLYVFTSEFRYDRMLQRETITRDINKAMRDISNQLPDSLCISSHSFRIGDITQLWEDSENIKFVKQTIRHQVLNTTSRDVNKLTNQEKLKRSSKL